MNRSRYERCGAPGPGWSRAAQDAREAAEARPEAPAESEARPLGFQGHERPSWQVFWSVLGMLFAGVVGVVLQVVTGPGLFCTTVSQSNGANIDTGADIALTATLLGLLAIVLVRDVPGLLRSLLLAEAAALSVAIGFVARDSAFSKQVQACGLGFGDDTTSTSSRHVEFAYFLWGLAIATLVLQALRGRRARPARTLTVAVPALAAIAVLAAALPAYRGSTAARRSVGHLPPKRVLVCQAWLAPEAFGGPQCDPPSDIGRAAISPSGGLECSTDLTHVKDKLIGIQVFYEETLIKHANIRSSDSETSPYAYFDRGDVDWLTTGDRLPIGRYRCRFLVNGKIARARTLMVGGVPFAPAPLNYRYRLALQSARGPRRPGPTRLGEQFTVAISARDLPANRAVRVQLCVNLTRGESCETYYLTGAKPTGIYWEVDRGEGARNLYRLSVRVRGHEVARRDLRLARGDRGSASAS